MVLSMIFYYVVHTKDQQIYDFIIDVRFKTNLYIQSIMSTNHNYFRSYFHRQSFLDITSTMSKTKKIWNSWENMITIMLFSNINHSYIHNTYFLSSYMIQNFELRLVHKQFCEALASD